MKFLAKVKNGELEIGPYIRASLLRNEGKTVVCEIVKAKRSVSQNNYYWFYLGIIEQETGQLANELHEIFKRLFLKPKFITYKGKEIKIPASTTDLNKVEFGEFLEKINAETNIPLPDPKLAGYFR